MSLSDRRCLFTRHLALLIQYADAVGLAVLLDQAKRTAIESEWNATHCRVMDADKRCEQTIEAHAERQIGHTFRPIGILHSVHRSGLAADLYVIIDRGISNERAHYQRLGDFWKSLGHDHCWGGDFEGFADLGHFSFEHEGRR